MLRTTPWPLPVWLCIVALFLYTLGQYSLLWWLPSYLEAELAVPRDSAGTVVSRFWTGMLCGQLFVAWWVLRIGARLITRARLFLGRQLVLCHGGKRHQPGGESYRS